MSDVHSATAPKPRARFGGYAALVAAGILLSRIAGLIRTRVMAHYLGNSRAADAFAAALKVPNFLQNLFGEGVLSASFIPVYARTLARGEEELAGRVAGVIATIITFATSIFVLLGVLLTPWLIDLIAPGFQGEVRLLTIRLVRILFPGTGILVLSAWCLGILNSHKKFFISYVAPVLWNAAMVATLVIFGTRLHEFDLVIALAWGTVVGCALQLGVQLPFVLRSAKHLKFGFSIFDEIRDVFRSFAPIVVGRGVVQLSAYIDQIIATLLPSGAVICLTYAQTIYLMPISLFGMSVAAAELPQMAGEVGEEESVKAALRGRLARGLRQISFFVVPTVVAFVAIGDLLIGAILQTGKFTPEVTRYVWYILAGSTVGLLAATLGRLYSSAFYALRDTRTPLKFATVRVILTGGLGYLFAFPLRFVIVDLIELLHMPIPKVQGGTVALGAVGLTASAGVAGWVEFLLLRRAMQKRIGRIEAAGTFELRLWIAAIAAGAISVAADRLALRHLLRHVPLHTIAGAIAASSIFGVTYFVVAALLGVGEVRSFLARFRRR
ncbi:MAG: murein biosynthesis integral membrane protein MurJ [Acidobacteria bacterium]|nr:MAG: murein biosynthesis integral membrane protein MurJ [Acidobacteriota bacterium]